VDVALSGLEMVWIYFHRALPCAIVFCPFGATHILSLRDGLFTFNFPPTIYFFVFFVLEFKVMDQK